MIAHKSESKFFLSQSLLPSSSLTQNLHPNKFMPNILINFMKVKKKFQNSKIFLKFLPKYKYK